MMGLLTPAEYIGCVEQAYRMHGEGRFCMDPKGHIVLDKYPGEWETMPSYIEEPEAAACKGMLTRRRFFGAGVLLLIRVCTPVPSRAQSNEMITVRIRADETVRNQIPTNRVANFDRRA